MTIELGHGDDLGVRLADLERKVQGLMSQDLLQNASIGAGGLTVTGTGGITITGGGVVNVNGAVLSAVTPTFTLTGVQSGFALPTFATTTPLATSSFTVPDGYSRVQLTTYVSTNGVNSTAGNDNLKNQVLVDGALAFTTNSNITAAPGQAVSLLDVAIRVLTGLSAGQTITVQSEPFTGTGWPANPGNSTSLIVSQLWFQ